MKRGHTVRVTLSNAEYASLQRIADWWGYSMADAVRFCIELEADVALVCQADEVQEAMLADAELMKQHAFRAASWLWFMQEKVHRRVK